MKIPSYEESLFTLRFTGNGFEKRGVSIYDFGQTLVSFQRLVNKTYLLNENRLEKGAFPRKEERESLALQIGARERKSDAFALIPLLTDPTTQQTLEFLGKNLFSGLTGYYVQRVMQRLQKEEDEDKRFFIGSINAEVVNLVSRIDAAGGVETIEIGAPRLGVEKPVVFDKSTKEYVKKLSQEKFLGNTQTIKGVLTKLLPSSHTVEIRRSGGSLVKVYFDPKLFDSVRYDTSGHKTLSVVGRPIFPMGATSSKVYEFEGHEVELVEDEKK